MTTKIFNLIDPITRLFAGIYEAQESPEEPGQFISPVDSTEQTLPALAANEAAMYPVGASDWTVVPDYRGTVVYDQTSGDEVEITEVGVLPINLGLTIPEAVLLAKSKADKIASINASCAAEIIGGFDSSALGAVHHYTATLEDQANLLGLIAIGQGGEFTCTDSAGVKARRAHTDAQLRVVLADGGAFKDTRLAKARTLKDKVSAAPSAALPDSAAVDALKW